MSVVRLLWRQPSFLVPAVCTLALGIAAPTALFAVVHATLLRPLPYPHAADVYTVRTTMTDGRFTIGLVASEELASLRRATNLVVASALVRRIDDSLRHEEAGARQLVTVGVTEGFFDVFGLPPALGRAFHPDDHQTSAVRTVILSGRMWRTYFSADPLVINNTIQLASGPALVVGVAPDTFDAPAGTDLWFADFAAENIGHMYDAYIRLQPGTPPGVVQAQLQPMWDALANKYPDQARNRIFVFRPLLSAIVGDLGPTALMAFSATALLWLLAIANVANLQLARGAAHARDLAVRVALGASRWHLVRLCVAESMIVAIMAAAAGIPIAYAAVRVIVSIGGAAIPRAEGLGFDPVVASFAAAIMVLAGGLVGVLPAFLTADINSTTLANEGGRGRTTGPRTRRLLGALVVCEVALAIALVAGAGRLLASAQNLLAVDPGFQTQDRLIIDALLPRFPYGSDPARTRVWSEDVTRVLKELGATHVGMASSLPLRREWDSTTFTDIVGRPVEPRFRPNGRLRIVSPGLFDALDIQVSRGRGFTDGDRTSGEAVAIVNEAWVRKFLPADADPLRERITGLFFRRVGNVTEARPAAIVGVVADVRYSALDEEPEPSVYLLESRGPLRRSYVLAVPGRAADLIPAIRSSLAELDPNVPLHVERMEDVVRQSLVWSRLGVLLMTTFGAVSLLLAGTGIFGVLAFVSAQRHGEMAVRLSLGATRSNVFHLVFGHGLRLAVIGMVAGTGLAWWMGALMSGYVYNVAAGDTSVLALSALIVAMVAAAAALIPAARAAVVEPSRALR